MFLSLGRASGERYTGPKCCLSSLPLTLIPTQQLLKGVFFPGFHLSSKSKAAGWGYQIQDIRSHLPHVHQLGASRAHCSCEGAEVGLNNKATNSKPTPRPQLPPSPVLLLHAPGRHSLDPQNILQWSQHMFYPPFA